MSKQSEILTRSKTRELEAYFHEEKQRFSVIPPKGTKRRATHRDEDDEPPLGWQKLEQEEVVDGGACTCGDMEVDC